MHIKQIDPRADAMDCPALRGVAGEALMMLLRLYSEADGSGTRQRTSL